MFMIGFLLITGSLSIDFTSRDAVHQYRLATLKSRKETESNQLQPPFDREVRIILPRSSVSTSAGDQCTEDSKVAVEGEERGEINQGGEGEEEAVGKEEDLLTPEEERALVLRVFEAKRQKVALSRRFMSRVEREVLLLENERVYPYVLVSLRCPDGSRIEGRFRPDEDCGSVYSFAKKYLHQDLLKTPGLRLFLPLPGAGRRVLAAGQTLEEAGVRAPASLLHLGLDPAFVQLTSSTQASTHAPTQQQQQQQQQQLSNDISVSSVDTSSEADLSETTERSSRSPLPPRAARPEEDDGAASTNHHGARGLFGKRRQFLSAAAVAQASQPPSSPTPKGKRLG